MNLRLHELARQELREAIDYYESERVGRGQAFGQAVADAFTKVLESPLTFQIVFDPCRRYVLKRYPYTIIYAVEGDEVEVYAVAHARRRPGYWMDRLEN